jgi:hypothetical protein
MDVSTAPQVREDSHPPSRSTALLWGLGGILLAVIVVGAVASALREPVLLEVGTPEGVAQRYLQAVLDDDPSAAAAFLSADSRCDVEDYDEVWVPDSLTVSLDSVRLLESEQAAEVRVRLRSVAGPGPFGDGGYSSFETLRLARQDGRWTLVGTPWPLYDCRERR